MKNFIEANNTREFKKPTYLEESITYHTECLPNMIKAVSMAIELGLKDP